MPSLADLNAQAPPAEGAREIVRPTSGLAAFLSSDTARLLGLVAIYSFLAVSFLHSFHIDDPDIWLHLRTGDWILAHRSVPRTDPFSSYGVGKSWIAYSWLFELVSAVVFARLGFIAVVLYEIVVRVAISVALFRLVRALCPSFWRALGLTAAALVVMTEVIGPRPGMLTIFFVILELDILLSAARSGHTKALWLLPPMFLLWANWHIQFVYGLFVLGLFAAEPLVNRLIGYVSKSGTLPVRQTWLVLAASGLATLLNPYGWKIYSTVFLYMSETGAYNAISELLAMTFREPQHFLVLLLALGAAMAIGWRRDPSPLWLILLAVTAAMAFRSVREVWFLAVVAVAAMAMEPPSMLSQSREKMRLRLRLAVAVCVVAAVVFSFVRYEVTNDWLALEVASNFPEGASRYVEMHHLPGPLLNDLSWGGFLIWRLPQLPVSIDGRLDVDGDRRIKEFSDLWTGKPGWATDPELQRANLVITPRVSAICGLLRSDPRFVVAYEDTQAVVFQRRS